MQLSAQALSKLNLSQGLKEALQAIPSGSDPVITPGIDHAWQDAVVLTFKLPKELWTKSYQDAQHDLTSASWDNHRKQSADFLQTAYEKLRGQPGIKILSNSENNASAVLVQATGDALLEVLGWEEIGGASAARPATKIDPKKNVHDGIVDKDMLSSLMRATGRAI